MLQWLKWNHTIACGVPPILYHSLAHTFLFIITSHFSLNWKQLSTTHNFSRAHTLTKPYYCWLLLTTLTHCFLSFLTYAAVEQVCYWICFLSQACFTQDMEQPIYRLLQTLHQHSGLFFIAPFFWRSCCWTGLFWSCCCLKKLLEFAGIFLHCLRKKLPEIYSSHHC